MKLTPEGDALWEKTWVEMGRASILCGIGEDGGYYIFGETDSYGAGDRDFFLLKITEDGAQDWYRTYGRSKREWPMGC